MPKALVESIAWLHLFSTLLMAGLVWFVQIVHYPLFALAATDESAWRTYETAHQARTTLVVGPLMLAEAATAVALLLLRPAGTPMWLLVASAATVAAVWLLTFALAVPMHARLASGFDAGVHRALVLVNWPRTLLWTARGLLAVLIARHVLLGARV